MTAVQLCLCCLYGEALGVPQNPTLCIFLKLVLEFLAVEQIQGQALSNAENFVL